MKKILPLLAVLLISAAPSQAVRTITIDRTLSDSDTLVFDIVWGERPDRYELGHQFQGDIYDPYYLITFEDWGGLIDLGLLFGSGSLDYTGIQRFYFGLDETRTFIGSTLVASPTVLPLNGNFAAQGARFIWGNPEGVVEAIPDGGSTVLLFGLGLLGLGLLRNPVKAMRRDRRS